MYVDGLPAGSADLAIMGSHSDHNIWINDRMTDEWRASSKLPSDDWIWAESMNGISNDSFQTVIAWISNGEGATSPNPRVGCVVVRGDRVVGRGFHQEPGL